MWIIQTSNFILNNRKGVERSASRLPVFDWSKSTEATYLEMVLMEMRSRFHKMGYVLQDKVWNSGYLAGHHPKWEDRSLDWLDELVFSSKKPAPVFNNSDYLGEKPLCGHPKRVKEMRLSITLQHMKKELVHIYNNVHVCSFLCIWHWRLPAIALKEAVIHCTGRVF